jgi:ketosteroid isomerase-like protein
VSEQAAANAALIDRFYEAFARRDPETMAACYAPGATFSDPIFRDLRGEEVTAMWRMLIERGQDLEVRHRDVEADETTGRAHWDADYTFVTTGRKVNNRIDSTFVFRDGLIAEHLDSFSTYRWTRQAFGPIGVFFGWSSRMQGKLRRSARERLDEYMGRETADEPSGSTRG